MALKICLFTRNHIIAYNMSTIDHTFGLNICVLEIRHHKQLRWTYQEAMQHHHPAPTSIWRVFILDIFLLLLLIGHGIPPEQVHGCLGFTRRKKKENQIKSIQAAVAFIASGGTYSKMHDMFSHR